MGTVFLVGAGPGDPELITLQALRLLRSADVVLYDGLVSGEVLALAPGALLVHVGKRRDQRLLTQQEIGALLLHYASRHATVVRLKGGDPSLFARTGEELDMLRAAGIPVEVVPGVTSAAAAAAAAGIALTDRRVASQVLFTTAHRSGENLKFRPEIAFHPGCTLAVYMPGRDYAGLCAALLQAGVRPDTPSVIVSCASQPGQQMHWGLVGDLRQATPLPAPSVLIVGQVASHAPERSRPSFHAIAAVPPLAAPLPQGGRPDR